MSETQTRGKPGSYDNEEIRKRYGRERSRIKERSRILLNLERLKKGGQRKYKTESGALTSGRQV